MPFKPSAVVAVPQETIDSRLVGIGFCLAAEAERNAPIEPTLLTASQLGMDDGDLRVLSLLTTWLELHHEYVIGDRLVRLVRAFPSERVRAYWCAVAAWLSDARRLQRLQALYSGPRVDLLPSGTEFLLARNGADPRFLHTVLRAPKGALRDRQSDVLSPTALIAHHAGYRNRVLLGPTARSDVWTVLEHDPDLSAAEAARRAGASFATAWQARRDFLLLRGNSAFPVLH